MAYIGNEPSYGVFDRQILAGDGTTTQYNLDFLVAQPSSLLVSMDGIIQEPEYSYTTGQSAGQGHINFSEAPENGARLFLIYMGRQLLTAQASTALNQTHLDEFNGNASTTAFSLTKTPVSGSALNFMVYIDNVYQRGGTGLAFTVSGDTITFTSAPPSGTKNIQVYQLNGINTLNTVSDGTISVAKVQQGVFDQAEDDATALAIALG
jgi:hypothetical protein|tara:strand:- start:397 stop:1020 length:624 start_codon:yes stop_codon:yes gene_type:complete